MADVVKAVTVSLAASTLAIGATTQATPEITVAAPDGTLDDNFPVTWTSSNLAVASVSGTGLVTAKSAGQVTIAAKAGGVTGSATLTVTMPEVAITAAQEAAIKAFPVGAQFRLAGPTTDFTVQVNG